ncbi:hypothetical protein [Parasediminibacterium sp. JCM 36343]|uniref:hypothetical protein n=1 Tax=Parasediminibacterium sp. JCM 36343 TaxID=3374279 RepID=UPI0039793A8B
MITEKLILLLKTALIMGIVSMVGTTDATSVTMALVDAKQRLFNFIPQKNIIALSVKADIF